MQELLREAIPATVRVFLDAVLEAPELLAESDVVNAFVNWLLQDEP